VRNRRIWLLVSLVVLALVGCGGGKSSSGGGTTTTEGTTTSGSKATKVGLVTDIGGLNDRSFNHLNYVGLLRAERELSVQGRVFESHAASDYVPNLSTLAQQRYDLVIGVGFLMASAIDTVAEKFPKVNFAIVDFSQAALKHRPKNVLGILFKEQESGYLAGYLAGLVVKQQGGKQVVSTVGGQKIPPVDRYIAGFQAGAKAADPGVKTLNGYSQDFVDQAKCKEVALAQIAAGSQVVMQVAGGCGLGALDAAKERHVWGIGADADQSFLGPYILTSALKKDDVAVFKTIETVQDGTFKGGRDVTFDVASGAAGLGKIAAKVPKDIVQKALQKQKDLAAHKVANIPTTVG
jgi:basic membrane protein A and related proteins